MSGFNDEAAVGSDNGGSSSLSSAAASAIDAPNCGVEEIVEEEEKGELPEPEAAVASERTGGGDGIVSEPESELPDDELLLEPSLRAPSPPPRR